MSSEILQESLVLPQINGESIEGDSVALDVFVPVELPYFEGHFPQTAILPGVVQLGWAFALGRKYFALGQQYTQVEALKFQHVIFPDSAVQISLQHNKVKNKLVFRIFDDKHNYSSGRIVFS